MADKARTPFTETEALLAVMEDDGDRARELLADSYLHELAGLAQHLGSLLDIVEELSEPLRESAKEKAASAQS